VLRGERYQASTDDLKKRRSPVQNCTHFLLRHDRECFVQLTLGSGAEHQQRLP
jgi:hypothetical protein